MNIVHINLFDEYGGAAQIANSLADASRVSGHRVYTFAHQTTRRDGDVIPIPFFEEAHFKTLMQKQQQKGLLNFYSNAVLKVLQHPIFQEADLVHLHCIYSGFFSYLLLPFLATKPLVWTFHDPSVFTGHCIYPHTCDHWKMMSCQECPLDVNNPQKLQRAVGQTLKENIFKIAPFTIVTPSKWMQQMVQESIFKDGDIRLIYNGIDTSLYSPGNQKKLRDELGLPQDKKILMFAAHGGVTNDMKGGKFVIQVLYELQKKHDDYFFLHIGAAQGIQFPGITMPTLHIPYINDAKKMAKYYAASDLFLSTSLTESFGLTVCESLSCGTPVVAFAVGGVTELIQHGETGRLVQTGDIDGFIQAIELQMKQISKIPERIMCDFKEKFSLKTMQTSYNALYKEKMSKGGAINPNSKVVTANRNKREKKEIAPKISVLLPVYNAAPYLREAIDSILLQTFCDYELLIIDDASQDASLQIIESYDDPRIKIIRNSENLGLVGALNKGLNLCKGKYIARMDADDIIDKNKFFLQFNLMEENPNIGVTSTWLKTFGNGKKLVWQYPTEPDQIKCQLLFSSALCGASTMIRRDIIEQYQFRFDQEYSHAEDYDMWVRLANVTAIRNIPEPLYFYRQTNSQVTKTYRREQLLNTGKIQIKQLKQLGIDVSREEALLHYYISMGNVQELTGKIDEIEKWFIKLVEANNQKKIYDKFIFVQLLKVYWECIRSLLNYKNSSEKEDWFAVYLQGDKSISEKVKEKTEPIENRPKVSVIIPTYNRREMLQDALESVLAQDYPNLEIIVTDNASQDGTDEFIKIYLSDQRLTYFRQRENIGPYENAKNALYTLASGEYAILICDDNYLIDNAYISKAMKLIQENPNMSLVYANCEVHTQHPSGEFTVEHINHKMPTVTNGIDYFINYERQGYAHITGEMTAVFDRIKAIEMGYFTEDTLVQDLILYLKMMLSGNVGFIGDNVAVYRIHGDALSNNIDIDSDLLTIRALEDIYQYALDKGINKDILQNWLQFRVFQYVQWGVVSHWNKGRKKIVKRLLEAVSAKYPQVTQVINDSLQLSIIKEKKG